MPQPSYTYASARLSALSKRLVEPQTVKRMADGTLEGASPIIVDKEAFASVETVEVTFDYIYGKPVNAHVPREEYLLRIICGRW